MDIPLERMTYVADVEIIRKRRGVATITRIDGREFRSAELAKYLGVNICTISNITSRGDSVQKLLAQLWKKREKMDIHAKVYTNGYLFCSRYIIQEYGRNVTTDRAYYLLGQWEKGKISVEELFYKSRHICEERQKILDNVPESTKRRQEAAKRELAGLQPRKETWELTPSGSWEKENKNVKGRPNKGHTSSSRGGYTYGN